jgi:CheY-like chemotaxis protein
MLEAQKLESLGVLAGGIAHDFNNLLTVILANATFARGDLAGSATRLAHIEGAARRAADLCRQMLAYAGRGTFVVENLDLAQLVQDTAQLLQVSISKKARLTLQLTPGLPAIRADASQLSQVVMNLVINASEALDGGSGEIRLRTQLGRPEETPGGVVHSFDLPAGECVCLEIADTGHGMGPATLARVFDPFFTTKFTGRGLGLAAVLGIMRVHNGALTVHSLPGTGTTFRLYFAATPTLVAPAGSNPATPPAKANGETLLIVDDEPIVLATADVLLRNAGYQTVLAADGHDAMRKFRADPRGFAGVLLDLTMPGLDGSEVLREMRAINPKVRVLITSGFSEHDILARVRGQQDVPLLRKPFTHETLIARVAELIAK